MSCSSEDQTIALASDSEDEIENSSDEDSNLTSATLDETKSEEELEIRAFSPRTRMSLTGCRPKDLASDGSDIEYEASNTTNPLSDENGNNETEEDSSEAQASDSDSSVEEVINRSKKKTRPKILSESEDEEVSGTPIRKRSSFKKGKSQILKHNDFVDGCENEEEKTSFSSKSVNETRRVSNSINTSQERDLTFVDDDIKLHSSKIETRFSNSRQKNRFSEDYDVIPESPVASSSNVINISSDESRSGYSKSNASKSDSKRLSRDEMQKEFESLEQLKNELAMCEKLHESVGTKLPDKGQRMLERTNRLKESIKTKSELLSNVTIDDSKNDSNSSVKIVSNTRPKSPTWEELSAGVNEIKPTFTGQIGMAKFTVQKTLTIDRLKDIHGSLKSCPGEDVLAEPPKAVKTSLMNHQRHALAWLQWREKQRPRGGILADDMGLGKTLTMISLILKSKEQEESSSSDKSLSDEDSSGEEGEGWRSKGRKDFYKGGTLVVCPASLAKQWENEVNTHTKYNSLSVCVHHGINRETKPRRLAKYDMVITTYNLVGREEDSGGALFGVKWNRIILDEAHVVRNHKTQCSIGVCALRGRCRWALTGTPVQNKVIDVYGLIKFLRCSPFDDLGHWKKWVENKTAGGQERLNTLMKSLMLRRTKAQLQEMGSLNCLPEKVNKVVEVHLHKEEMNVYQKILSFSQSLFAQFLHQRAEKMNDVYYLDQGSRPTHKQLKDPNGAFYKMHQKVTRMFGGSEVKSFQILLLILRLRQICDHPGLIDTMLDDEDTGNAVESDSDEHEIDLLEQLNKLHLDENSSQPNLSINDSQEQAIAKTSAKLLSRSNPVFDLERPSSKMKAVLNVLEEKVLCTKDKAIIISQWTSVLNILKTHLARKGIIFSELNGKVLIKNRQEIINEFNKPNTPSKVLLLSLTAGGVGLNLVGANHLMLIDLHWNPQLEAQAQDRIYRVGQKKTVYIYKFMCKETIEERIKALQEHKLSIANGVLTGVQHGEGSKLSIDELKNLFGM